MTQFLRDEGSDSEEVLTPLMLDGTYLSRNFATLGPFLTLQPPCLAPSIGSQVTASSLGSIVRLLPFPPYPRLARLASSFSLFTRLIPRGTRKEWKGDRSEPDTTLRGTQGKDETSTGTHETKPDKSMR